MLIHGVKHADLQLYSRDLDFYVHYLILYMSRDMTKPTKWLCDQWRLRSAWASAQSDQSLFAVRLMGS